MARITGIGGVFFKSSKDSAALATWYQKHLGMTFESFGGAVLKWPDDKSEDQGVTVWHVAEKESQWFSPSNSPFMINYRVDNLGEMIAQLREGGVEIRQRTRISRKWEVRVDHGSGRKQGRAVGTDDLGR